jgi:peroxiredoxin
MAFRSKLPVGSPAPDFSAVALDSGEKVQLRNYWKEGDVVIEFGSLT